IRSVALLAFLGGVGVSSNAHAVSCPGTQGTSNGSMLFTVTTSPASTCYAYAPPSGTLTSCTDPFLANHANYVLLDSTNHTGELKDGAITVTGGTAGTGTFSINGSVLTGYSSFVLALQDGQGPTQTPDWGAFLLGALSGTWSIQELTS